MGNIIDSEAYDKADYRLQCLAEEVAGMLFAINNQPNSGKILFEGSGRIMDWNQVLNYAITNDGNTDPSNKDGAKEVEASLLSQLSFSAPLGLPYLDNAKSRCALTS